MKRLRKLGLILIMAFSPLMLACGETEGEPQGVGTIVQVATDDGRFTVLVGALEATGLVEVLSGTDEYTVFAPTDAAFDLLPDTLISGLSTDQLREVLLYHVVPGSVGSEAVVGLDEATSADSAGTTIDIQVDGNTVVLNGRVQVIVTDIIADNGIIHVIDAVLIPGVFPGSVVDVLAASPRFSTLVDAVADEGLAPVLADAAAEFTVFAPTNPAFGLLPADAIPNAAAANALQNILLYHVLGSAADSTAAFSTASVGGELETEGVDENDDPAFIRLALSGVRIFIDARTEIVYTDIEAENGFVHIIDSVLLPGNAFPGTTVQALQAYPRFTALVGAVVAEGLVGAVTNRTVFAPVNEAFDGLDLTGVNVAEILQYHLLDGLVESDELMVVETTLLGEDIVTTPPPDIVLNGTVNVIRADVLPSDGVIHVIDAVLLPPEEDPL